MLTKKQFKGLQKKAAGFLKKAKITITPEEAKNIEVVDHGFGASQPIMVEIVVYENNDIYCAKELVMFPGQIAPQHRHPPVGRYKGKRETFRCRHGEIYFYTPGKPSKNPKGKPPEGRKQYFTVWHETILKPGQQYTLQPDTWHWFQSGPQGAVVSEFSSNSIDEKDVFKDPDIKRITEI